MMSSLRLTLTWANTKRTWELEQGVVAIQYWKNWLLALAPHLSSVSRLQRKSHLSLVSWVQRTLRMMRTKLLLLILQNSTHFSCRTKKWFLQNTSSKWDVLKIQWVYRVMLRKRTSSSRSLSNSSTVIMLIVAKIKRPAVQGPKLNMRWLVKLWWFCQTKEPKQRILLPII